MRTRLLSILCIFAALARASAGGQPQPEEAHRLPLTPALINQLSDEAQTNNPALRAAAARVAAAEAQVQSVRRWPDPQVMAGGTAAREMMRQDEGDIAYGVSQELPLFGRPKAARAEAQAGLGVAEAEAAYAFQMLRLEIARQLFRAALADQAVELGGQDLQWLEALARSAEDRYQAGTGSQAEALRAQNELSRRREQLATDDRDRAQDHAELNRLLHRPLTRAWPRLELPPVAGPIEFSERLQRLVLGNEARLKVLRQEAALAEAAVSATKRERLPRLSLGAEGRQYSGTGGFREGFFSVTLSVPWLNSHRYKSDARREEARRDAARLEVENYESYALAEARRLATVIDAARRRALLERDEIIPRSELALQSAHAAWTANRGSFLEMMEARRQLLEARLSLARAVAEQYSSLAELALCCGVGDLEAIEMLRGAPASTETLQP